METNIEALRYPVGKFERPTHFSPEAAAEWIKILRLAPSWMDACIENLDEFQLQTPYRDGGWTIQQVVHHMADEIGALLYQGGYQSLLSSLRQAGLRE